MENNFQKGESFVFHPRWLLGVSSLGWAVCRGPPGGARNLGTWGWGRLKFRQLSGAVENPASSGSSLLMFPEDREATQEKVRERCLPPKAHGNVFSSSSPCWVKWEMQPFLGHRSGQKAKTSSCESVMPHTHTDTHACTHTHTHCIWK